ncbi:hypothetical protein HZB03_04610 [Candidatus Woesearchaeota archaeon]|nr:hypothetical protein [Candidatus Woesearchaeota archaeon]
MTKIQLKPEDIRFEKLTGENSHKIATFSSSVSKELDAFLKEKALREHSINFSKTYLFFHGDVLAGYVTLLTDKQSLKIEKGNPFLVQFKDKTEEPYMSVPALKIGRMCVSDNYNSQLETSEYHGLGRLMFASVLNNASELKNTVGCRVITTHAKKNTGAYKWYLKMGFCFSHNDEKTKDLLAKEDVEAIPMFYDINRTVGNDPKAYK